VRFVLQPCDSDVFITDEAGRDVYWVQGPTGGVGRWWLRDLAGGELAAVRQHGSPFLHRFGISTAGRRRAELREQPAPHVPRAVAALRNAIMGAPARTRYTLDVVGEGPLRIVGDATALEYGFLRGAEPVATVSALWMAPSASWGVSVTLGDTQDAVLLLAATATIEIGWGRMGRRAARPAVPLPSRR
jgi:uncharacterized protein YxjI